MAAHSNFVILTDTASASLGSFWGLTPTYRSAKDFGFVSVVTSELELSHVARRLPRFCSEQMRLGASA